MLHDANAARRMANTLLATVVVSDGSVVEAAVSIHTMGKYAGHFKHIVSESAGDGYAMGRCTG